jgi:hypothetical protein
VIAEDEIFLGNALAEIGCKYPDHPDFAAIASSKLAIPYFKLCMGLADDFPQTPRDAWRAFGLACLRSAQKFVVLDAIMDEGANASHVELKIGSDRRVLVESRRLGLIAQLFDTTIYPLLFESVGSDPEFWQSYFQHMRDYCDNCGRELLLRKEAGNCGTSVESTSDDKSAMLLIVADYICHISGPQHRYHLYSSFRYYNEAAHILDDVQDMAEDLKKRIPSVPIFRITNELLPAEALAAAVIMKGLGNGVIMQMLDDADSFCQLAGQHARRTDLQLQGWLALLYDTKDAISRVKERYRRLRETIESRLSSTSSLGSSTAAGSL